MANEKIFPQAEITFKITNMVCEECGEKITSIIKNKDGVTNVIAKAFKKQIHITYYTDQVNQDELKEALEKEGYNVIEV